MKKPENPPAYPSVCLNDPGHPASVPGMTLWDWFAGRVMAVTLAELYKMGRHESSVTHIMAGFCYEMADAMLAERAKGEA